MSEAPHPPRFEPRPCATCGESLTSWSPMKKYCSGICRRKAEEARQVEQKRPAPAKEEG